MTESYLYCIDRLASKGRGLCLCHASYLLDTSVIYLLARLVLHTLDI